MFVSKKTPYRWQNWKSKSRKCVNLVSFPFMHWNPVTEIAGNPSEHWNYSEWKTEGLQLRAKFEKKKKKEKKERKKHQVLAETHEQDFNIRLEESWFIVPRFRRLPYTKDPCRHSIKSACENQDMDITRAAIIITMLKCSFSLYGTRGNPVKSFRVQRVFHLCMLNMELLSHQRSMSACVWMLCAFLCL